MSLVAGGRVSGSYSLDNSAITDSMAKAIEDEFAAVYQGVKGEPLPPTAQADMRLLFVAISRGVLRYLRDHDTANVTAKSNPPSVNHQHAAEFDVDLG